MVQRAFTRPSTSARGAHPSIFPTLLPQPVGPLLALYRWALRFLIV
ncbi:MAG: hypothetical protein H0T76_05800 [Nannocystis sp.]|nr:hypothetical protein [Nannocystis sp.]MBA3545974.1 hypothetical protein [Nannocystis sp.]